MSQTPVKTQLKTQIWPIDLRNPPFDSDHHECYVAFPKAPVRAWSVMVSKPLQSTPPAALFVFAFCLVMIASSRGMGETYAIFLLPLSESFGWNRANVTSIFAIYMVAFGFGSLLSGLLYDRFGPRFNYTIGLALLAACYGFAGSLNSLVSFYFV